MFKFFKNWMRNLNYHGVEINKTWNIKYYWNEKNLFILWLYFVIYEVIFLFILKNKIKIFFFKFLFLWKFARIKFKWWNVDILIS